MSSPCSIFPWRRLVALATLGAALGLGMAARCGDDDAQGNNNNDHADAAVQNDAASDAVAYQDATVTGDASAPAGHTDNQAGHYHMTGKEDPLVSCVSCHGSDLRGGSGPSCYDCHTAADHTYSRGGVPHLPGSSGTCITCHGPSNTGGLGPSCQGAGCH